MRILWVTAVAREAESIRGVPGEIIIAGVGRTNAAAATTEAILRRGPFDAAISVGIAGSLPGSGLAIGGLVIADACIYAEEGIIEPRGFRTMEALGFDLGPFVGNRVPVGASIEAFVPQEIRRSARIGAIATVATCSGTDAAAEEMARRTGAIAEAMEGAAVVHAALRLGVPGGEIRAISNATGDRSNQRWDLEAGFAALARLARRT